MRGTGKEGRMGDKRLREDVETGTWRGLIKSDEL